MSNSQPGSMNAGHVPVLLDESIAALVIHPGGTWLDGTFGGGGHSRRILDASAPDGRLIAVDADRRRQARHHHEGTADSGCRPGESGGFPALDRQPHTEG